MLIVLRFLDSSFFFVRTGNDGGTIHWFLSTTDAGPNEIGARKIIHSDPAMMNAANVLFTDTTCLEHSQHLVSLSCLKAIDRCLKGHRPWGYYSSLATCANVCRDMCKSIFQAWSNAHGHRSAKDVCKKLWPKACAGRWSGCDKPEQRFLECGKDKLAPIMSQVIRVRDNEVDDATEQKKTSTSTSKSKSTSHMVDELQIEESRAYSEKMGRWRKRTLECIHDSLWWRCVEVMNSCRRPLSHLQNFLQSKRGHWGHIAQLTTGKSDNIEREFTYIWQPLVYSGCVSGDDVDSQFVRNLAFLRLNMVNVLRL